MAADQLKLMKTNTEIILTGTQQQLDKVNIAHLEIGQASVLIVSSALRNLGSWFDLNLKMTEQINKTCQSVYYHLHNIRQIRKFLTPLHQIAYTRRDHGTHWLLQRSSL